MTSITTSANTSNPTDTTNVSIYETGRKRITTYNTTTGSTYMVCSIYLAFIYTTSRNGQFGTCIIFANQSSSIVPCCSYLYNDRVVNKCHIVTSTTNNSANHRFTLY